MVTSPTFAPQDVVRMRTYELMASPLVYPGQRLTGAFAAAAENSGEVTVRLLIRRYGDADGLANVDGPATKLGPGQSGELSWVLPDCASQPIAEVGFSVSADGPGIGGRILLDRMGWNGTPDTVLRPPEESGEFWQRAWVNSADNFKGYAAGIRIAQDQGEGLIIQGTRQWTDYRLDADMTVHLGRYAGLAARVGGLRRFYAARLCREGQFQILRVFDEDREVLASTALPWRFDKTVPVSMTVCGRRIIASAGETVLTADDDRDGHLASGGAGLLVADGAVTVDGIRVTSPGWTRHRDAARGSSANPQF